LPEVVKEDVTGFVVDNVNQAVESLSAIEQISPKKCVQHAHHHFSAARMADAYHQLYSVLLSRSQSALNAA
jgi:hypothetical protein